MPDSAKLVMNYAEITERQDFCSTTGVTSKNFEGLIWEYQLAQDVLCQVQKEHGLCKTKHRHGYLGKVSSGKTVLMGSECVKDYFKDNEKFKYAKKKLINELAISEELRKLSEHLLKKDSIKSQIKLLKSRIANISITLSKLESDLPSVVINHVRKASKTSNTDAIISLRYEEKDENNNKKVKWITHKIGSIQGADAWSLNMKPAGIALNAAIASLNSAVANKAIGLRKLREWNKLISDVSNIIIEVVAAEEKLSNFKTRENIETLLALCRKDEDQLICAAYIIREYDKKTGTKHESQSTRNSIYKEVKQKNGGRDFIGSIG